MPRLCGIATFTRDLCDAVRAAAPEAECYAGAVSDREEGYNYPDQVRFELLERDLDSYRRAADWLNFNNAEVLCLQHEFGIYGGPAGSHLLALLKEVRMPVVTTLHTVLETPDEGQRRVMNELVQRSARLVVMAQKGAEILHAVYAAPPEKTRVIPHGIPDIPRHRSADAKEQFGVGGRQVLLTFGLLGPGKGIEHVIESLPAIVRQHPDVVYIVLGATHPQLVAREGERYRMSLEWLTEERGVKDHVIFYNQFVSPQDLVEFIRASDIYITPYLNQAQITSGTLAQVFGAGKAVISSSYWHAQELLADGRGMLVPFANPTAISDAVHHWLAHPEILARVQSAAWDHGRTMTWSTVAKSYLRCFAELCGENQRLPRSAFGQWTAAARSYDLPHRNLDHVIRMTDGTGIFQHAQFTVPDFEHGYCTDDNARAFLLCQSLDTHGGPIAPDNLNHLSSTYLAFLNAALVRSSGRFRNFLAFDRRWLEDCGSEDSHGRALWALGSGAGRSRDSGQRHLSAHLLEAGLASVASFTSPRAWAFTLLGLQEFLLVHPGHNEALETRERLVGKLMRLWLQSATDDWPWFENAATYDNARLAQALLQSGHALGRIDAVNAALSALRWLASIQKTQAGCFRPIGSNGFYSRDGARADYDQQPVEAQAMVAACLEAFHITDDASWLRAARRAFEWFLGRNDLGRPIYDPASGGCGDGLHHDRVNANQGAESTLAFHLALADMITVKHPPSTQPQ
ncbi:MAG: glycosyltransferase family 4 protein [Verrucomicrobiales bacterium]